MDGERSVLRRLPDCCGGLRGRATAIHRWSGAYVGFLSGDWFFDGNGRYLGWVSDGKSVWRADGNWLGELVDDCYVIRRVACAVPVRRSPPVPPVPQTPPERPRARLPRQARPGWTDALEGVGRIPSAGELVGNWCEGDTRMVLEEGGRFLWDPGSGAETAGGWDIKGSNLSFRVSGKEEPTSYAILEYSHTTLTLREISVTQRTFELVLQRKTV